MSQVKIQRSEKYVYKNDQKWPEKVVFYTDGASRGNPGPASFGVRVSDTQDQTLYAEAQTIGEWSNNIAEYEGVCRALELAIQNQVQSFCLKTDSQFITKQLPSNSSELTQLQELKKNPEKFIQKDLKYKKHLEKSLVPQLLGKYKITTPHMVPFFEKCVQLMEDFQGTFEIQHVRREENARADKLANMALDS